jgi:hypothetical protein
MDVFSESLRRATDTAPPTRIDVDAIITGERRRRRFLIGGSGMSAAAVGVAVVLLSQTLAGPGAGGPAPGAGPMNTGGLAACVTPTPSVAKPPTGASPKSSPERFAPSAQPTGQDALREYLSSLNSPEPMGQSPGTGTPAAQADELRIGEAFAAALRATLPGIPFTDWVDPTCSRLQVVTTDAAFPFESAAVVTDGQGRGDIVIHMYAAPAQRPSCDQCAWHQDLPGGGLAWGELDLPSRVDIWRPDGTGNMILAVDHHGDPPRTTPPATRAQMIAIGTYPALSLHAS